MKLTPKAGRNGSFIANDSGFFFIFDKRAKEPAPGTPIEVMITHTSMRGPDLKLSAFIVRAVTADDILVQHGGFECAGTMCRTSARPADGESDRVKSIAGKHIGLITPGRTPVLETSNINTSSGNRRPLKPGAAYIAIADLLAGESRITGVPDLEMICPGVKSQMRRTRTTVAA